MTEKEKVQQIAEKYGKNYSQLSEKATSKEYKTVLNFIVDEANRKQREIAGLAEK